MPFLCHTPDVEAVAGGCPVAPSGTAGFGLFLLPLGRPRGLLAGGAPSEAGSDGVEVTTGAAAGVLAPIVADFGGRPGPLF